MRADSGVQPAAAPATGVNPFQWFSLGPAPILQDNSGLLDIIKAQNLPYLTFSGSGNVSSLAVDPRDPNTVYAAANSGGVWKTVNGGQTWTALTDNQPGLTTTMVALDPRNPNTVYATTGRTTSSGACGEGYGILKSTDAGQTWNVLPGVLTGSVPGALISDSNLNAIAIDPAQSNTLLVAASGCGNVAGGVYRSTDGGATWSIASSQFWGVDSIVFDSKGQYAYAGIGTFQVINPPAKIYRSADAGATWTQIGTSIPSSSGNYSAADVYLTVSPSNPNIVLASISRSSDGQLFGLYKSQDSGQTWTALSNAPDYCGTQCEYYPALAFHPLNPNIIYAAGLDFWRSMDGGLTWSDLSLGANNVLLHADHHSIAFSADASVLYDANDGGVFSTNTPIEDSVVWHDLNTTLGITEFYNGISIHPDNVNIGYAGTQDNGTLAYANTAWSNIDACGDAGTTLIDPQNPSTVYVSCITGWPVAKSTKSGEFESWMESDTGIAYSDRREWSLPFAMDMTNPSRLYLATYRVYQSLDGAGTWTPITGDLTGDTSDAFTAMAISPADPAVIYVGSAKGHIFVTGNATAGSASVWTNRTSGLPTTRYITSIVADPTDPQTAYLTCSGFGSGHIFKTSNQGLTWTDISGNLPNTPANALAVDPDIPGVIYVGNDLGVFRTADGVNWAPLGAGLPHVSISGLALHRGSRTLRAGSFGRGMWDLGIPVTAARITSLSPTNLKSNTAATLTVNGVNFDSTCTVQLNGTTYPSALVNANTLAVALKASDVPAPGSLTVAVTKSAANGGVSNPMSVKITGPVIPSAASVTNAASVQNGLVSGSWVSIKGTNLSSTTRTWGSSDFSGNNLPTSIDGVSVTINGRAAYVYYVSSGQLNVLAPDDPATGPVPVVVSNALGVSNTVIVNKAAADPELFMFSPQSNKYVAAMSGNTYLGPVGLFGSSLPTRPAAQGETITLYGTGFGATSPGYPAGMVISSPLNLASSVQVSIGGVTATVRYAGLVSPGLYQLNVEVPSTLPNGDAAVVVNVAGVKNSSPAVLTVGLPKLVVTKFSVPTAGTAGQPFPNMSVAVQNTGNAPAGPFRVGFYMSTSWNISTSDLYIGFSCAANGLVPGAIYTCTGSLGIPASVPPDTYFMAAIADDQHQVQQIDTSGNVRLSDNGPIDIGQ